METDLIKTKYKLKKHPVFGFRQLNPLPSKKQLADFYKERYYQYIQKMGKGAHDARLLNKKAVIRNHELLWLKKTYFIDKVDVFNQFVKAGKRKVLDIGCGSGELLGFMKNFKWDTFGVEPSIEVLEMAKKESRMVFNGSFEDFFHQNKEKFSAIVLANVLEHVVDPMKTVEMVKELLQKKGVVCIQVPNDFNQLQYATSAIVKKKEWWINIPDHVNYFDFRSLEKVLEHYGFEIVYRTTDFPMELFLLMGENYIDHPEIGKSCHEKRVNFELSLPKELRRNIYEKLAELGSGRQCIIYARKK